MTSQRADSRRDFLAGHRGPHRGPGLADRVIDLIAVCSRANDAAHHYANLKRLSNQALANRGLTRIELPRAAFIRLTGQR